MTHRTAQGVEVPENPRSAFTYMKNIRSPGYGAAGIKTA